MSRELIVRPEAEAELAQGFEWYESRLPGLGLDFIRAVDNLFNSILRNPLKYPVVYKAVRRGLTRRFP
jgi:toxin ParE1/3/4